MARISWSNYSNNFTLSITKNPVNKNDLNYKLRKSVPLVPFLRTPMVAVVFLRPPYVGRCVLTSNFWRVTWWMVALVSYRNKVGYFTTEIIYVGSLWVDIQNDCRGSSFRPEKLGSGLSYHMWGARWHTDHKSVKTNVKYVSSAHLDLDRLIILLLAIKIFALSFVLLLTVDYALHNQIC